MNRKLLLLLCGCSLWLSSCKKYLDTKPDKKLVIPANVADLQALLDQNEIMNFSSPSLGETSTTDYWLLDADLASLSAQENAVYLWGTEIYYNGFPNDWSNAYNPVYFANIALENIESFERTEQNKMQWDNVKGSALLFRGKSFLDAVFIWCKAYQPAAAATEYGLPLRLGSDFNKISVRSSLLETYEQIISDLRAAIPLLPQTPLHVMRPSKPAALGYLARTFLSMGRYDSCLKYTQQALDFNSTLLDYNTVDGGSTYPFGRFSPEVIMHSSILPGYYNLDNSYARIDSTLYNSYDSNDLRKTLYYRPFGDGSYYYRGSYARRPPFNGIGINELYLMKAECAARLGDKTTTLNALNDLLTKRYQTGKFVMLTASDASEALALVLKERRKELVFHGLRWMDIKRFNLEGANITLTRKANGKLITLSPNSNRYATPIPPDVIALNGMEQNPL